MSWRDELNLNLLLERIHSSTDDDLLLAANDGDSSLAAAVEMLRRLREAGTAQHAALGRHAPWLGHDVM